MVAPDGQRETCAGDPLARRGGPELHPAFLETELSAKRARGGHFDLDKGTALSGAGARSGRKGSSRSCFHGPAQPGAKASHADPKRLFPGRGRASTEDPARQPLLLRRPPDRLRPTRGPARGIDLPNWFEVRLDVVSQNVGPVEAAPGVGSASLVGTLRPGRRSWNRAVAVALVAGLSSRQLLRSLLLAHRRPREANPPPGLPM